MALPTSVPGSMREKLTSPMCHPYGSRALDCRLLSCEETSVLKRNAEHIVCYVDGDAQSDDTVPLNGVRKLASALQPQAKPTARFKLSLSCHCVAMSVTRNLDRRSQLALE